MMAPCLLILVEIALPRDLARPPAPRTPLAVFNLFLLVASVLSVSGASMTGDARVGTLGLAVAVCGFGWFARRETAGGTRLLPHGACVPWTALGACYAAIALLLIGVNTEIFVPYFLQTLHGMIPLQSGYLSALMAAGWSVGSIVSSGVADRGSRASLAIGPVLLAAGLIGLALLMPTRHGDALTILVLGCSLASMGLGIGACWPHIAARIFTYAADGEKDLAASSLTVVTMVANAFGSALGRARDECGRDDRAGRCGRRGLRLLVAVQPLRDRAAAGAGGHPAAADGPASGSGVARSARAGREFSAACSISAAAIRSITAALRCRPMSACAISISCASAVVSRSSHIAAGRPVAAETACAQSRAPCAAGPNSPSMPSGSPTTSPPASSFAAIREISAALAFSFARRSCP